MVSLLPQEHSKFIASDLRKLEPAAATFSGFTKEHKSSELIKHMELS